MEESGDRKLEKEVEELRQTFNSGRTREESWRRSQLVGLLNLLREKEEDVFLALDQDLGKHRVEAYRDEIGPLVKTIRYALEGLNKWMSGNKVKLPLVAFKSSGELISQPLGLILIISSWNFPFGLSLEPLIGAIAAGNVMILKPSELAPATSSLLSKSIPKYLDNQAIKVIEGSAQVGHKLLQHKWDKIFFTGSPNVGRMVLNAAANHLTPVILELGGKCPAIVDSLTASWERKIAIKRIVCGKFGTCGGQACIGIDYILSDKKFSSTLVDMLKKSTLKMFGENPKKSKSMSRIVNKKHFSRLISLLEEPMVKASIVHGGSYDEDNLFIEPTILLDPPLESSIMTEEIFGPLLPIITLEKIEDSIAFMKSKPKPLTIYAFTNNEKLKKKLLSETSSGSLVFNDAIVQFVADTLPFGGVGESGYGRYHGKFSFEAFSHERAILRRSFVPDFWFRYPPWTDQNLQLFRLTFLFDYLGLFLTFLGFKK